MHSIRAFPHRCPRSLPGRPSPPGRPGSWPRWPPHRARWWCAPSGVPGLAPRAKCGRHRPRWSDPASHRQSPGPEGAANPLSIRERRRDCSFTSISSSSQIRSRSCDWPILRGARDEALSFETAYGEQATNFRRCQGPDDADTPPRHQVGPGNRLAGHLKPAALDCRYLRSEGGRLGSLYHHRLRCSLP